MRTVRTRSITETLGRRSGEVLREAEGDTHSRGAHDGAHDLSEVPRATPEEQRLGDLRPIDYHGGLIVKPNRKDLEKWSRTLKELSTELYNLFEGEDDSADRIATHLDRAREQLDKEISSLQSDWRDAYVCCEHVLELKDPPSTERLRHRGFRVCCEECYPDFLLKEESS